MHSVSLCIPPSVAKPWPKHDESTNKETLKQAKNDKLAKQTKQENSEKKHKQTELSQTEQSSAKQS